MSLLVAYVLVAFMYIFTLPPINHPGSAINTLSHTDFIGKTNSSGTAGNLLHRGIRSTIENKTKIVVPATTACIIFFLFFGGLTLLGSVQKVKRYFNVFYSPHLYTWLSLRTIRI